MVGSKNKKQPKVAQQNSNISEMWETSSKTRKTNSVSVGPSPVSSTNTFILARPPAWGSKMLLINFKHKIMTSANYTYGIGTGYTSKLLKTKKYVCTIIDLKMTSKNNQSN